MALASPRRRHWYVTTKPEDPFPSARADNQAQASQSPALFILAGRTTSKVETCIEALQSDYPHVDHRFLQIDLSSQNSVRAAAKTVLGWSDIPKIDVVVNSAGVMGIQERTLTEEGIEMHFATNHIAHWLLTCLIMPKLIAAAVDQPKGAVRVVNVSSASPMISGMRWSDMTFSKLNKDLPAAEQPNYAWFEAWGYTNLQEAAYNPLDGYNRSKVASVLFSIGLTQRLFGRYGILSIAVHPGVIQTELGRQFPPETLKAVGKIMEDGVFTMKSLGAGGATSLVAALDPALAKGVGEKANGSENWGTYLADCQISGQAHSLAVSSPEAERLWQLSQILTGEKSAW